MTNRKRIKWFINYL